MCTHTYTCAHAHLHAQMGEYDAAVVNCHRGKSSDLILGTCSFSLNRAFLYEAGHQSKKKQQPFFQNLPPYFHTKTQRHIY